MPLAVYYRPEQNATAASLSPSAGKPAQVVADWLARGRDIAVLPPEPVTPEDLMLAHAPDYVRGVLAGQLPTGFGDVDVKLARSTLYTVGSLLTAARAVCGSGRIACSPTSGFHHAGWDSGGGYCTFNGLVVTAFKLIEEGRARNVAILDLDTHYGNGTDDILRRLERHDIVHFTAGRSWSRPDQSADFLRELPNILRSVCTEASGRVDLLLYQAGADAHIDDPLGGWLTTAQMRQRDALVFEAALGYGIPVVWNLAGGYQRDADGGIGPVLAIHRATLDEAIRVDAWAAAADAAEDSASGPAAS